MNNTRLHEILIDNFKKEFREKIGKGLKVTICSKWEEDSNFTTNADFWGIAKLVFDYTGWTWKDTYAATQYRDKQDRLRVGTKNEEKIFRRGIINYIAVNNGVPYNLIARETNMSNHTAIMNSVRRFEERLETELDTQKIFREILTSVKENYHLVRNKTTLKTQVVDNN